MVNTEQEIQDAIDDYPVRCKDAIERFRRTGDGRTPEQIQRSKENSAEEVEKAYTTSNCKENDMKYISIAAFAALGGYIGGIFGATLGAVSGHLFYRFIVVVIEELRS